jgi:hypothetical protein
MSRTAITKVISLSEQDINVRGLPSQRIRRWSSVALANKAFHSKRKGNKRPKQRLGHTD